MPSFKAAIKKICDSSSISNKLIYSVYICFIIWKFLHLVVDPCAVLRHISIDSRIFRVSATVSPGGSADEGSYIVVGKIDGNWSTRVPLNINHDVYLELNLYNIDIIYSFISKLTLASIFTTNSILSSTEHTLENASSITVSRVADGVADDLIKCLNCS